MTFGNVKYAKQRIRLAQEAKQLDYFDRIYTFSPLDLQQDSVFWEKNKEFIEKNPRGYGYWIWKAYLIDRILNELNEGDMLVYCDAGCSINMKGKNRLLEYEQMVEEHGFVCFQLANPRHTQGQFTKAQIFETLGGDKDTPQIISGIIVMKKCPNSFRIISEWKLHSIPDLLNDCVGKEDSTFIENRHDQSILSILVRKHGAKILDDETWAKNFGSIPLFPFHATRLRD